MKRITAIIIFFFFPLLVQANIQTGNLFIAIKKGSLKDVLSSLKSGALINEERNGYTPIMQAIEELGSVMLTYEKQLKHITKNAQSYHRDMSIPSLLFGWGVYNLGKKEGRFMDFFINDKDNPDENIPFYTKCALVFGTGWLAFGLYHNVKTYIKTLAAHMTRYGIYYWQNHDINTRYTIIKALIQSSDLNITNKQGTCTLNLIRTYNNKVSLPHHRSILYVLEQQLIDRGGHENKNTD